MAKENMVSPQIWNVSSNLCSSCINGMYEKCTCNEDDINSYRIYKDVSTDSLDQCLNTCRHKSSSCGSVGNDFIFDDEFEEDYSSKPLPPSTTDWDSIDSMLENDAGETENQEEVEKIPLSRRLSQNFHMQMVFVDSDESDKGSMPDVEVYYEDEENIPTARCSSDSFSNRSFESERNIESRDSGYVTTDVLDVNIEKVTDQTKRRKSIEPVEASTRVLASLHLHEEHETRRLKEFEEQKQKQVDYDSEIHRKNVEELREMKRTLETRITQINLELVEELQSRDELHLHHEALLMEADDIAETSSYPSTPTRESASDEKSQKAKKKYFWSK